MGSKQAKSKGTVAPSAPQMSADAAEELFEVRRDFDATLERQIEDLERETREAERRVSQLNTRRAWLLSKVSRSVGLLDRAAFDALIDEQWFDDALRSNLAKCKGTPWPSLRANGATDQQIVAKLKTWPRYEFEGYGVGAHVTGEYQNHGPAFRVGPSFNFAGAPEIEFTGPALVKEVRRVMGIGQPVKKPAASSSKKPKPPQTIARKDLCKLHPPAKTSAAAASKGKNEPKPAGGVAHGPQTYGQWLSTLRGNWPKDSKVELGNDHDNKLPDLVKLFEAKVRPSDAKQILIGAGWLDGFVPDNTILTGDRLLHFGSSNKLQQHEDVYSIEIGKLPAGKKQDEARRSRDKLIRRQTALAPWRRKADELGIELRGAMAPEAANRTNATKPRQSWLQFVHTITNLQGGPTRARCDSEPWWRDAHAKGLRPVDAIEQQPDGEAPNEEPSKRLTGEPAEDLELDWDEVKELKLLFDIVRDGAKAKKKAAPAPVDYALIDGRSYLHVQTESLGNQRRVRLRPLFTARDFTSKYGGTFEVRTPAESVENADEQNPDFAGCRVTAGRNELVVGPRMTERAVLFTLDGDGDGGDDESTNGQHREPEPAGAGE